MPAFKEVFNEKEVRELKNYELRWRYRNDKAYREAKLEYMRRWRAANPDRVRKIRDKAKGRQNEYFKKWYAANKTWWNAIRRQRAKAKKAGTAKATVRSLS